VYGLALAVSQHLDLDVARVLEEFLHVDLIIAESGRASLRVIATALCRCRLGMHHAHAAATAAARGLDDHRIADLARDAHVLGVVIAQRPTGARHTGHARRLHRADRGDLVAHQANHVGARADEDEADSFDRSAKSAFSARKP
jgi:hypothetical protein